MTFDKNPDHNAPFTANYRKLFDTIRPSERLLATTRSLYTAAPRQTPAFRLWPAAATLCAACLLLTIGLQFWPQPKEIAPPGEMLRTASQLPEQPVAHSSLPGENAKGRMAEESTADDLTQEAVPLAENASTPELSAYPLAKQQDAALKPFIKPADVQQLLKPANIWQLAPQWAARAIRWLNLW